MIPSWFYEIAVCANIMAWLNIACNDMSRRDVVRLAMALKGHEMILHVLDPDPTIALGIILYVRMRVRGSLRHGAITLCDICSALGRLGFVTTA